MAKVEKQQTAEVQTDKEEVEEGGVQMGEVRKYVRDMRQQLRASRVPTSSIMNNGQLYNTNLPQLGRS
jgi:hypothetical protein